MGNWVLDEGGPWWGFGKLVSAAGERALQVSRIRHCHGIVCTCDIILKS